MQGPPAKRSRGSKNSDNDSESGKKPSRKTPPPAQSAEVARLASKLQVAPGNSLLPEAGEGGKRGGRSSRRR